jgi:ABC-type multidrug transport system fused ATPase/permease subunit
MKTIFEKIESQIKIHPNWLAAATLGVLISIFISPSFFGGRYLAPVDTLHYVAPYLDITTQMLPWYHLSAQLVHSGHFPFWNIYSGNGLPLMANMQSAVFFPLTWLFYIFSAKFALITYTFFKLLLMGLFTFWYLRELKTGYFASLVGAVLFAFCNANVIWFLWPLTSVLLILPLSFLLIEKYFNNKNCVISSEQDIISKSRAEESLKLDNLSGVKGSLHFSDALVGRDDTKKISRINHGIKYALWLAPVTALGLFAGHPQTFFYIFMAIATYTIFKAFSSGGVKPAIKDCIMFGVIYLAGLLISAAAVLPFLEYVKLSANLIYRAGFAENPFFLPKALFLANLIPDFYGNTGVKNFSYLLVPNYGELALGYIGISGLILALLAFGKKMQKHIWFFVGLAIVCVALVYHAPIIYYLINKLPGFNLNYNNRLLYLWAFCASILAAFGLDNLLDGKITKKRLNWTFGGFAVFAAILILANRLITHGWQFAHNLDWHTVSLWQDVLIAAFVANLVVAYFVLKNLPKKKALCALFILVFIETGIHGMIFMKTSTPENFYPVTPALTFLQSQANNGNYRVFTYGDNLLPNIGTWYGINELNDHDTIYLQSNKLLKARIANYNYSPEYTFDEPNLNALRFLSVKFLLYPKIDGEKFYKEHAADLAIAYQDQNYIILSLKNVFPRAFLLSAADDKDLNSQLADLIQNPNSHPVKTVNAFKLQQDGTETIAYNTGSDNYLITTDNYYPGWTANFASGGSDKVTEAFGLRAVALRPAQPALRSLGEGGGSLTITYEPQSFILGLEISGAAMLVWLVAFWVALRQNNKN